ncbi:MAG: hypothetical protein OFPII_21320 [Osedax symbiont Rs1]|nr:MAG: hypothetical protein OFPII_21320 [Osedax symbiont Rs1]
MSGEKTTEKGSSLASMSTLQRFLTTCLRAVWGNLNIYQLYSSHSILNWHYGRKSLM